ncbi:TIGR00730 family Rossman fold protein [Candidatus Saccharibacteria bacterium]|nr:TIGR00730 family Rossman fold protein [Candidatus Saccharibacteria bacterium]
MDSTIKPLTLEQIMNSCNANTTDEATERVCLINEEISQGLNIVQRYPKKVTFFGSARFKENQPEYIQARALASRLVKELDYTVLTGGGPGIMEAANRGAKEAGGHSIGLNIQLPQEQTANPYQTVSVPFHYFFTRKVTLSFAARLYIYFPGGYGTLDEFYEILTLVQTGKIHKVPIICVGAKFWEAIDQGIHTATMLSPEMMTIDPEDTSLYTITDDIDTIMHIARNAQMRV